MVAFLRVMAVFLRTERDLETLRGDLFHAHQVPVSTPPRGEGGKCCSEQEELGRGAGGTTLGAVKGGSGGIDFSHPKRRQRERCLSRHRVLSSQVQQTKICATGLTPKRVEIAN